MDNLRIETTWRDRLEAVAGRRRDVWVVAAVAAVAVVAGLALWARGAPATVAPPATSEDPHGADSIAAITGSGASPGEASPAGETILVHVAGAVRRPGLYEMPSGARVADAVEAAGGPRPRAALDSLNLAEALVDGQKVEIVRRGEVPAAPVAGVGVAASPGPSTPAVVNLNTADQAALETIPEVGPVTATAILEYRAEIGSFTSVEQLIEVSGIGPATLEAIKPYVTV